MKSGCAARVAWSLFSLAVLFSAGSSAVAQEEDPKKDPGAEEDELTPEQAMAMLKDIGGLMKTAEELLNNSSRGKALETEKELLDKLEKEFKDDPGAMQKAILEKIRKLMQRSEKRQKDAVEKMTELIKRARTWSGSSCRSCQRPQNQPKPGQQQAKPQSPSSPATSPYDPNRQDPPNIFRSRADRTGHWGDLPPRFRDPMMHGKRAIDEYPEEFQEVLREYMKRLAGDQ